jgi:hypothetical protein
MLSLETTCEDGELFVSAGLVLEALGCHSQGTQEGKDCGSAVSALGALLHIEDILL